MSLVEIEYIGRPEHRVSIELPLSKSIVARQMMMAAYSGLPLPALPNRACADLTTLHEALTADGCRVDVGESGTALRFMVACLAGREGVWRLVGTPRLLQRPVVPLVKALTQLGAKIEVTPEALIIEGRKLRGGKVTIDASESSQYVSSLMLLGSSLPGGLEIELTESPASAPYITMTARMLQEGGVKVSMSGSLIKVDECHTPMKIGDSERDWSAASYFLEVGALTGCKIDMPGLRCGLQGDSLAVTLFETMPETADMHSVPDLVPAYAATLCGKGMPFKLTGLAHLKYKESDRLASISGELRNLGFDVKAHYSSLEWSGERFAPTLRVKAHSDHRIVMALAPLAAVVGKIRIEGAEAVVKSFPEYFRELAKTGYKITKIL